MKTLAVSRCAFFDCSQHFPSLRCLACAPRNAFNNQHLMRKCKSLSTSSNLSNFHFIYHVAIDTPTTFCILFLHLTRSAFTFDLLLCFLQWSVGALIKTSMTSLQISISKLAMAMAKISSMISASPFSPFPLLSFLFSCY